MSKERQFLVVELKDDQKLFELLKVLVDNEYNVVEVGKSDRIDQFERNLRRHLDFLDDMLKDMVSPEYIKSFVEKLVINIAPMVLNQLLTNRQQNNSQS